MHHLCRAHAPVGVDLVIDKVENYQFHSRSVWMLAWVDLQCAWSNSQVDAYDHRSPQTAHTPSLLYYYATTPQAAQMHLWGLAHWCQWWNPLHQLIHNSKLPCRRHTYPDMLCSFVKYVFEKLSIFLCFGLEFYLDQFLGCVSGFGVFVLEIIFC